MLLTDPQKPQGIYALSDSNGCPSMASIVCRFLKQIMRREPKYRALFFLSAALMAPVGALALP
jgi:hypothetical protein